MAAAACLVLCPFDRTCFRCCWWMPRAEMNAETQDFRKKMPLGQVWKMHDGKVSLKKNQWLSTCEHEKGCERKDYEQAPDNCYVYRILYTSKRQAMQCHHISDPTIMELLRVRRGATEARLTSLHFWMVVTLQGICQDIVTRKARPPRGKRPFSSLSSRQPFCHTQLRHHLNRMMTNQGLPSELRLRFSSCVSEKLFWNRNFCNIAFCMLSETVS